MKVYIFDELDKATLLKLLKDYDMYIQDANDLDKYRTGWMPVCVEEFYNNEFIQNGNK